ncbi:hypothetical protein QAD02_008840 [Eretmocerus hayati]|uniref:Uncharacterized protein n=1 Tax=Eretmocerus hayati TaxID=131215 RepID=A0ACC2N7T6_9HYME|nr:hypothetical protein QAD02_008840 [Eretmocerus hayati]
MFIRVNECVITKLRKSIFKTRDKCYSLQATNSDALGILFFGSNDFALPSLQALHEYYKQNKLRKLEVVTAYKGEKNSLLKYVRSNGIVIHPWPPEVGTGQFEIGVVVSFGYLIPSRIIELFPLGMINVHGSLLPRWRGAAPICFSLMNGDTQTGITIMKIMPKRFDIGPVIAQKTTDIGLEDTHVDLQKKLAKLGAKTLVEVIENLPHALHAAKPQKQEGVTYAPKVTKELSFINWNQMTARDVYNLQRALTGMHPLRCYFGNEVIKLVNVKEATQTDQPQQIEKSEPGSVIYDKKLCKLYICCKNNTWITVEKIVIPDKPPQSAVDFGSGFVMNRREKKCQFH